MNETINLMKAHTSVRRFTEEQISDQELRAIIDAGRAASSWKNFQSYSIIVVRSKEKKEALFDLVPQEAIRQSSAFLLFVGDLNRAQKGVQFHTEDFYPEGTENLLISSVDAAFYGGVIIGLVRYAASQIAELFKLPDYTYPVFGIALGTPNQNHAVKPRLPYEAVVFEEEYREQDESIIQTYDRVQTEYAGERAKETWSQRLAAQFGQEPNQAIDQLFKEKKLEK